MSFAADVERRIETAVASGDQAALKALLAELYEPADQAERPFDAAIRLRPEISAQLAAVSVESDAALNWANRISRASRWLAYQAKTSGGFKGLRIVEEGDSWFQYPVLLKDTIDHLSEDADKAIFSLSGAGDLLGDMAERREYLEALAQTGARVLLLSGGGNDLLGGGRFAAFLESYEEGKSGAQLLNLPRLEAELGQAINNYRKILSEVQAQFPKVRVLGHAYDVPHPKEDGAWIGKPLKSRGIPLTIGRTVVEAVLDRWTERLTNLQRDFDNFRFVNLRGKVDQGASSWFDELHPKGPGYGRAAKEFRRAIAELTAASGPESAPLYLGAAPVPVTPSAPGVPIVEASGASRVVVLDPGHGGAPPPNKIGGSSWNNAIGPQGTLEKTLTFDIATRTQRLLERSGIRVHLTRQGDVNLSLADRAAIAKARRADAFVSIHFNASPGHNAQGTETFVHDRSRPASRRLCVTVQRAMVAELGLTDRNASHPGGVKVGAFGVIDRDKHGADTAAVLLEVSFLDRADEERKLQTEAYRNRIAAALARGIEGYFGTGVESLSPDDNPDDLGDAIEMGAAEAGVSVTVHLGSAEAERADTARGIGGHALPSETEADPSDGSDFARQLAESMAGARGSTDTTAGNDVNEFASVDPGAGFDVSDLGSDVEADTQILRRSFAGVESSGFDMARFDSFIRSLDLRHFRAAEFLFLGNSNAPGGGCGGKNGLPPEELWGNIARTARMLDEIRKRLGAPIRVLSCYRNAAYNSCVGGESGSLHMRFNAVDWTCTAGTVEQWHRTAIEVRRLSPEFAGGIGRYERSRFIHVDTRGTREDWVG